MLKQLTKTDVDINDATLKQIKYPYCELDYWKHRIKLIKNQPRTNKCQKYQVKPQAICHPTKYMLAFISTA